MSKLTQWFDWQDRPTLTGWYDWKGRGYPEIIRLFWNGRAFVYYLGGAEVEMLDDDGDQWRGLAEPYKRKR